MLLTIGVPTYNRAEHVAHMLRDLVATPASERVEILVIDDGGTDDASARLSQDPAIASRVRVLKNESNLGYPRTFARVFAECRTEYVMIVADDDEVIPESLDPLLTYLKRERPAFVSPQFLRGSSVYRGRSTTAAIEPRDFLTASAHASGLIYRVEDCRPALAEVAERVAAEQADALVYPQVIVVVRLLIAASRCEWLASPTVTEGSAEPSGILDADGRAYWALTSRWKQLTAFDALLTGYADTDATGVAQEMLIAHRERVFHTIASAIRSENSDLGAAFDAGARKTYQKAASSGLRSLPIVKRLARRIRGGS